MFPDKMQDMMASQTVIIRQQQEKTDKVSPGVASGPCLENSGKTKQVDPFRFPEVQEQRYKPGEFKTRIHPLRGDPAQRSTEVY